MDGPGTYSQPPYAGGSKDESGTAAKDTISIGSGDRVSGEDRMGMEVHKCGDLTNHKHYLSWNMVQSEKPDFHRPEDFGRMMFS